MSFNDVYSVYIHTCKGQNFHFPYLLYLEYHDDGSPGDPQDALNGETDEITEAERQKDRHERIVVLAQLLHLACSMVSGTVVSHYCILLI